MIFGPLVDLYSIKFYSLEGGPIKNPHGVSVMTEKLEKIGNGLEIFLIPGGYGALVEVNNKPLIENIKRISESSKYVLTACTGSTLLARTGLLTTRMRPRIKGRSIW